MHNKPLKVVSLLMIIAMAIAPLRGLFADVSMDMNHAIQAQVNLMDVQDSMTAGNLDESCDQCDMQQCCQASSCNYGHCFSSLAVVSLNFQQPLSQLSHHNQSIYKLFSISFQHSPLLQPPRA